MHIILDSPLRDHGEEKGAEHAQEEGYDLHVPEEEHGAVAEVARVAREPLRHLWAKRAEAPILGTFYMGFEGF